MTIRLPRETDEPLPITVMVNGESSTDFNYAIVISGRRPPAVTGDAGWSDPLTLSDDSLAIHLDGTLEPGRYEVYVRINDEAPWKPVELAGAFHLA